jgi:hypothetical protein
MPGARCVRVWFCERCRVGGQVASLTDDGVLSVAIADHKKASPHCAGGFGTVRLCDAPPHEPD